MKKNNFVTEEDFVRLTKKIRALLSKEEQINHLDEKVVTEFLVNENSVAYFKILCNRRSAPIRMDIKKKRGNFNLYVSRQVKRPQKLTAAESFLNVKSYIYSFYAGPKEKTFSCDTVYFGFHASAKSSISVQFVFGTGYKFAKHLICVLDSFPKRSSKQNQEKVRNFEKTAKTKDLNERLKELYENKTKMKELCLQVCKKICENEY